MDLVDFGDMTDLRIRLQVLATEANRRLVTVFGSGVSNAVIPDVTELTRLFRNQIPEAGLERFDERIQPLWGTPFGYQNAASLLMHQAGEEAVMRAIRTAVLQAYTMIDKDDLTNVVRDENKCRLYAESDAWAIPEGYKLFAKFFAGLNGRIRGPIITTNFDPLIEIALRAAGVPASPIPIPVDSAPTPAQLRETNIQPVLHIHGYWTGRATSNVPARITADRPQLDRILQEILRNSVVLVVGYSGWPDGFMKSLRARILNDADMLGTDVLWATYEADPTKAITSSLKSLMGTPGFSLYLGVDGHSLFASELHLDSSAKEETRSPFGYSRVTPRLSYPNQANTRFADGGQPNWADAVPGRWPMLSSTRLLKNTLDRWLEQRGGGGVIATGPLGEGKSLGIRQVAMATAVSHPDWRILWREPAAPPITETWLQRARQDAELTLICVDDADLAASELANTQHLWGGVGSGVALLLASHDGLWHRSRARLGPIDQVPFHGITRADADGIAEAWDQLGLLPHSADGMQDKASVANQLASSAGLVAAAKSTLFGAVLEVRYGSELGNRVEDLLEKLGRVELTNSVNLGEIFAGICVMQHFLDKNGSSGRGASRPVIAGMVGLNSVFADGKILDTLGREAAVTFAGNRIYSRHPAIASTVVEYVDRNGSAERIYSLIGRAGGALKKAGAGDEEGYRDAYLLSQALPTPEAVWAAKGAVEGTGGRAKDGNRIELLEPRVTLLSAMRRAGGAEAITYARKLATRVSQYTDFRGAIRAFLVEFSISMRNEGYAQNSAGLAALALDDRVGFTLDAERAGYALVSLTKSILRLDTQTGSDTTAHAAEASYVLLERIRGADEAAVYVRGFRGRLDDLTDCRSMSASKLCGSLALALHQPAVVVVRETGIDLDIDIDRALLFDTLRTLAERAER